jgi:hypothetical protein
VRSGLGFEVIEAAATALEAAGLLQTVESGDDMAGGGA